MKKMIFKLIPFIINIIICVKEECLKNNNSTSKIYLSTCLSYNDELKNKDILKNNTYCCLLTLTYENKSTNSYCITTLGDKDVIEERIDMFKYQKYVKKASIDCSSNYLLMTTIIFIIFLLII